jgi:hypothetical protein
LFSACREKGRNQKIESKFFVVIIIILWNQGSSVGITTGYGLDGPGSIPGKARFLFLHTIQTGSGAHSASYPVGTGGEAAGA